MTYKIEHPWPPSALLRLFKNDDGTLSAFVGARRQNVMVRYEEGREIVGDDGFVSYQPGGGAFVEFRIDAINALLKEAWTQGYNSHVVFSEALHGAQRQMTKERGS